MKKKIVAICLVAAMALAAAIGGTLAYFTDNEAYTNTFTIGDVDITLTEDKWVVPQNAAPGIKYEKNPIVNNVGENPAWIRVDVTLDNYTAFAAAAVDKYTGTFNLASVFGGHDTNKWTLVADPAIKNNEVTYSYYYNTLLAVGESTAPIFTDVTIPALFDNSDMAAIGDFNITIAAHAIQTADGYTDAAGAFANYIPEEAVSDEVAAIPTETRVVVGQP